MHHHHHHHAHHNRHLEASLNKLQGLQSQVGVRRQHVKIASPGHEVKKHLPAVLRWWTVASVEEDMHVKAAPFTARVELGVRSDVTIGHESRICARARERDRRVPRHPDLLVQGGATQMIKEACLGALAVDDFAASSKFFDSCTGGVRNKTPPPAPGYAPERSMPAAAQSQRCC